jgi:hypothetical protein
MLTALVKDILRALMAGTTMKATVRNRVGTTQTPINLLGKEPVFDSEDI